MKTSLHKIVSKPIRYISVNTIRTSYGQNHNIKNIPPTPKNSVSPWTENKIK